MTSKRQNGSMRLTSTLLLASLILLTDCASRVGSCRLLAVRDYDPEFTARFVEEFEKVPEGSPLSIFTIDAVDLRDAVRACKGEMK